MERKSTGPKAIGDVIAEKNIVLKGADALTRGGFTQVPNAILKSTEITPPAKLTYAMLLSYAWQNDSCFPGQDRLAKDMGAGKRSVVRYIEELERLGFIKVKRRGLGKPNIYEIDIDRTKDGKP